MKPEPCNCDLLKRDGKRLFPFSHSSCSVPLPPLQTGLCDFAASACRGIAAASASRSLSFCAPVTALHGLCFHVSVQELFHASAPVLG